MHDLIIQNVAFSYGKTPVLNNVNLTVRPGDVISLLGPNGSGKSTLMKLILGILKPQKGSITLGGDETSRLSSRELAGRVAYVPQTNTSPFGYTGLEMVMMGRSVHRGVFARYTKEDEEIALHAMERLGVADLRERIFTRLSGGQRQLLILARAIAQGARLLILDEPVTGLDYGNQLRLLERIYELAGEGYTFIKSTHFPDHSLLISGRAVMLKDGVLFADGGAQEVITPENIKTMYDVDIRIADMEGGLRMCVPSFLGR